MFIIEFECDQISLGEFLNACDRQQMNETVSKNHITTKNLQKQIFRPENILKLICNFIGTGKILQAECPIPSDLVKIKNKGEFITSIINAIQSYGFFKNLYKTSYSKHL